MLPFPKLRRGSRRRRATAAEERHLAFESLQESLERLEELDGASTGPTGDRPTRPEIDVVRVSYDNQRVFNVTVSKDHDHSSRLT